MANSGTITCSLVPLALTTVGTTLVRLSLPALSRIENSTSVFGPKLVPVSSIVWPALAEACPPVAGVPSFASAVILVIVGIVCARLKFVLTLNSSPLAVLAQSAPVPSNASPVISPASIPWCTRSTDRTTAPVVLLSSTITVLWSEPSQRLPVTGSIASPLCTILPFENTADGTRKLVMILPLAGSIS